MQGRAKLILHFTAICGRLQSKSCVLRHHQFNVSGIGDDVDFRHGRFCRPNLHIAAVEPHLQALGEVTDLNVLRAGADRDGTRHTFTIDELGVDLSIPPESGQRVSFTAAPGTYRFYCRPHAPGMEGVLVVS